MNQPDKPYDAEMKRIVERLLHEFDAARAAAASKPTGEAARVLHFRIVPRRLLRPAEVARLQQQIYTMLEARLDAVPCPAEGWPVCPDCGAPHKPNALIAPLLAQIGNELGVRITMDDTPDLTDLLDGAARPAHGGIWN